MLKTLLKKQFLELNTFYFQNRKTGKMRSKGGIIGMIVLFIFVFASVGFAFYGMGILLADTFIGMGLDWLYFAIMGTVAVFLGVFGGVFNTYAGLYHAKDNEMLLAMPISPSKILFARMTGVYAMGLLYEALVFVPAIICYWVMKPITVLNVVFPVLLIFVIGFLVLALTCALGWVVALISSKLKNKTFVTVLLTLVLMCAYYFIYFRLNTFLQQIVQNAEAIGESVRKIYPMYLLGRAGAGEILPMLGFTAICAAFFALTYFILSKTFVKITTTKQTEKKAEYKENQKAKASSADSALLRRELKHFISSPTYMMNTGLGLIILPVLGVIALVKASDAGELIEMGKMLLPEIEDLLPVFAASVVCMLISMNGFTAPSVSLEGKSIWIVQSMPLDPWQVLQSKQKAHIYLNAIPVVIATTAIGIAIGSDYSKIILMNICALVFVLFTSALGLFTNLLKPNLTWTNETVPVKQSISVMIVIFGGWIVAAGFGVGAYFLRNAFDMTYYLIGEIVILALATRLMNGWIKKKGTKIFAEL